MKIAAFALAAAVTSVSSAAFVEYYTVKTQTSFGGTDLDVYVLFARFSGSTDTVVNAFNFNRVDGTDTTLFYHRDLASASSAPTVHPWLHFTSSA